jgi:hypothetical protein
MTDKCILVHDHGIPESGHGELPNALDNLAIEYAHAMLDHFIAQDIDRAANERVVITQKAYAKAHEALMTYAREGLLL